MNGSSHLIIGYQLSGESHELRSPGYGELSIGMAECEGLALVTLARKMKNDQVNED